jgi:hypothetical protein
MSFPVFLLFIITYLHEGVIFGDSGHYYFALALETLLYLYTIYTLFSATLSEMYLTLLGHPFHRLSPSETVEPVILSYVGLFRGSATALRLDTDCIESKYRSREA